ncbi:MAG: hypothetical protein A2068_13415 [Ignavibacteria bacterium GWB2_35_6b]|nr:MAG: hypothetical protein A2068_13415 [Ignavibacteria bacterium GWB2_35_6b]
MEIRHLKLIKAASEEGSLTAAGKKLFLTQSALSHQLKEIETEYGVPFFQRIGKKMILTQAGERVLSSAKTILDEIQKTDSELKSFSAGDSGVLRISTECYTCYHWLSKLLKSFHTIFPNVELQIIAEATRKPLPYLLEGKLDVAIVSSSAIGMAERHSLRSTKLFSDELVVVTYKNHRLTKKSSVRAHDFIEETLILYTVQNEDLDVFQYLLNPAGVAPKKVLKLQLTEAIIEMVKAELGITVMAKWAIKPYLKNNQLVIIPFAGTVMKRNWYAATINSHNTPRYIDSFINHLSTKITF